MAARRHGLGYSRPPPAARRLRGSSPPHRPPSRCGQAAEGAQIAVLHLRIRSEQAMTMMPVCFGWPASGGRELDPRAGAARSALRAAVRPHGGRACRTCVQSATSVSRLLRVCVTGAGCRGGVTLGHFQRWEVVQSELATNLPWLTPTFSV